MFSGMADFIDRSEKGDSSHCGASPQWQGAFRGGSTETRSAPPSDRGIVARFRPSGGDPPPASREVAQ